MKSLKEDIAYGIYDRPGPSSDEAEPLPEPVIAGPQMSVQLSTEKPPIDDEDYTPSSISALSNSAAEIARHVPDDQIEYFYRGLHKLLDASTDRTAMMPEEEDMNEAAVRRKISNALLEMISDDDKDEFEQYRAGEKRDSAGVDYFGDEEEPPVEKQDDDSNLDALANEFGFSGPSGVRQYITRILKRLGFFAEVLDDAAIASMIQAAIPEYISTMRTGDYIDDEDAQDLSAAPNIVTDLPSFKYFFVSGFILPSYREYKRVFNNSVRTQIETANLPKSLHDMVFNQATGLAKKDFKAVQAKLKTAVESGDLGEPELASSVDVARNIISTSKSETPTPEDFVSKSLQKWQSLNRSRRQALLRKALSETLDEM